MDHFYLGIYRWSSTRKEVREVAYEPKVVVKSVRKLVPDRASAARALGRLLSQLLTRWEIEALAAEARDDALFFVSAVVFALLRHPLGSVPLERALKAAAGERVRSRVDGLSSRGSLKPVLYGVLYSSVLRQFPVT